MARISIQNKPHSRISAEVVGNKIHLYLDGPIAIYNDNMVDWISTGIEIEHIDDYAIIIEPSSEVLTQRYLIHHFSIKPDWVSDVAEELVLGLVKTCFTPEPTPQIHVEQRVVGVFSLYHSNSNEDMVLHGETERPVVTDVRVDKPDPPPYEMFNKTGQIIELCTIQLVKADVLEPSLKDLL